MTAELFMAASLLMAPVGSPEPTPPPERWAEVSAAIRQVAIEWEIMDPREVSYIVGARSDFQLDIDCLRQRRIDLADAPHLVEAAWLPAGPIVDTYISFNRAFYKGLDTRLLFEHDRADTICGVMRETDRLYRLWDQLKDSRSEYHYVTFRRQQLKRLRDGMGVDAFEKRELPRYVPDDAFVKIPGRE